MSVQDMLKKIMTYQAQFDTDVRNNQLDTKNPEKQLGSLLVPKILDHKEGFLVIQIQIQNQ